MTASDMAWGEPVWSDAAPADPPPPAVDWRKSIPREFVARTSPAGRPAREPVRPEGSRVAPAANGQSYGSTSGAVPAAPTGKPAGPAEPGDDTPPPAGRHTKGGGRDEPSRANGVNGVNGTPPAREPQAAAGQPPDAGDNEDLGPSLDDTGPWNELDREIARALATALAGRLAQYVTGPILPLVADELARMVGSQAASEDAPGGTDAGSATGGSPTSGSPTNGVPTSGSHTAERRPRHFGDGTPRR